MTQRLDDLTSESTPPPAPRGLLRIAWERRLAVAVGACAGVLVALAYYLLSTPLYTSSAQILVVRKHPDAVTGGDRLAASEDYVATHQALLKSPLVIDRAIKEGKLASLRSLADTRDPTEALLQRLSITRSRDPAGNSNNVLTLAFRGADPDECNRVLDALIRAYREVVTETYGRVTDSTVELMARARTELQKELTHKEEAYREFRRKAPLIWRGKDGINPRQERLEKIEAQRTALLLRQAEVRGRLAALERAIKSGHSREVLLGLVADLTSKAGAERAGAVASPALQDQLFALLLQKQKLLERLGPNHPEVKSLDEQIATARECLSRPAAVWGDRKGGESKPALDPVQWALQSLGQELEQLEASERLLAMLFDREQQEARKLSGDEVQDGLFRNDIARTQTLYDTIVKRLQDASLVKDFGGYDARLLASPGSSGAYKVQPSALVAGALAILLAVLFGCGLAYLAETTDTRFRSADELRRLLGAPVLGRLPRVRAEGAPDALLCTYHRPESTEAEVYRGLRTALYFRTRGSGPQVWQIASPGAGDGKTTLAANLAVSLAQSGKRVVLIDANLRAPRLHQILGVQADTGLAPVLAGDAALTDALQPTAIPGLTLLPCGPLPSHQAELLTSGRFEEVLAALKAQSDYVLIDSPALLTVTDASALAAQADGVLLALRGPRANRQQAEQARELLASVNAHLLGVVLTEVGCGARPRHQPSLNGHTSKPVTV